MEKPLPVMKGVEHGIGTSLVDDASKILAEFDAVRSSHVEYLRRLVRKLPKEHPLRQQAVDRLIRLNECNEQFLKRGQSLLAASSFRKLLVIDSREAQISGGSLGFKLNPKHVGVRFARSLGADCPKVDRTGGVEETLDVVSACQQPVVVKPEKGASSKGVFVVHGPEEIFSVGQNKWFRGYDELQKRMSSHSFPEAWQVEEFLAKPGDQRTPAPDLKFYCFYGRVGVVLEVERYPTKRYCWWDREGKRIETGKYSNALFEGMGFDEQDLALVERMSARIPVAFIRIDFLKTVGRFVFGEFTPRPGGFHKFDARTDQLLGDLYLRARSRLMRDLINGKEFEEFKAATGMIPPLNATRKE